MTKVRMQWLGSSVLGIRLLLQGCAVGSSDLQYHLALEADPSGSKPDCTVELKSVVDETLRGNSGPLGSNSWTIRNFQIALERRLHRAVKDLACSPATKTPVSVGSVKWLASYAYETTDPDQDLRRFEEFLSSRKLARELILQVPIVADARVGELEGFFVREGLCDRVHNGLGTLKPKTQVRVRASPGRCTRCCLIRMSRIHTSTRLAIAKI